MMFLQTGVQTAIGNAPSAIADYAFNAKIIDSAMDSLISKYQLIASGLAITLFLITLAWNYGSTAIKNLKDKNAEFFVDYEDIARTLIILGVISIYSPIIGTLIGGIEQFNNLTKPSEAQAHYYGELTAQVAQGSTASVYDFEIKADEAKLAEPGLDQTTRSVVEYHLNELNAKKNNLGSKLQPSSTGVKAENYSSLWDTVSSAISQPFKLLNDCLVWLSWLVVSLIRIIVTSITINVLKVLIVIGPLAFAFSILPLFKNQINIWFGTLLGTGLVFTTMNILDSILLAQLNHFKTEDSSTIVGDSTSILGMALTIIIMYLLSFWLTTKFVGKGDGGKAVGKAVGVAVAAGAMIASGGTAAPAVSNAMSSAAKTGSSIIGGE